MSVDIRDIIVVKKDVKGANYGFKNIKTGKFYTRYQLVRDIKKGLVINAHVRTIKGREYPCSNPNIKDNNIVT